MGLQSEPYDEDEQNARSEKGAAGGTGDSAGDPTAEASASAGPVSPEQWARATDRLATLESSLAHQARDHADLIHRLCHELRTPITVINGFSRLLLDSRHGELSERQLGFVKESLKACGRLDLLVADLLEASPDSGSPLRLGIVPADLDATIRSTVDSLAPLLADRSMRVELNLESPMPHLAFDRARIEQVVTNLLTNAIRYGPVGGAIRVGRVEADSEGGRVVEVYVEDDGPGIAEVDRKRVFEPYVRGEGHSDCAGMGIGLAICQRIVAAHAGSIRVDYGSTHGARFIFSLPIGQSASEE